MLYSFRGKLTDGRTLAGTASGDNPVAAAQDAVTQTKVDATLFERLTLVALSGANVKVRAPKKAKAKPEGATEADKAAGANHMANVAKEERAETQAPSAPQRAGRSR